METKAEVLKKLHDQEDALNKQVGKIDNQMKELKKRKTKLTKKISGNMLLRNKVINWEDKPENF